MESVNLTQILTDVRVILDQNAEDFNVSGVGEYTLELNDVISKEIIPAVQWAHTNAPVEKLAGIAFPSTTVSGGALPLPSDYMRLVSVRANSWQRALSSYYREEDPQVSQILSGYPGLMPTAKNPAMVLRYEGGAPKLLLYPYVNNDGIANARYIPQPVISGSGDSATIGIEPEAYQAFLYYLAHLVKLTYNEQSSFAEQAKALL